MLGTSGSATLDQVRPEVVDRSSEYCEEGSSSSRSWSEVATNCWEKQLLTVVTQDDLVHRTPEAVVAPGGPSSSY